MWSQHCTNGAGEACRSRLIAGLVVIALAAGCASGPKPAGNQPREGEIDVVREVPPEAQTLYEQAVASMAAGDAIDAELRFQEFLLQFPDYPGAHVNLAIIFAGRGDLVATENSLTDALMIEPEHPQALNLLGMTLRRQGKFEDAESAYLKAVTAHPDYALAHYNLGVLYDLYLRRYDKALSSYERYQALAGEDQQVTRWIADLKRRVAANQRTANVTE